MGSGRGQSRRAKATRTGSTLNTTANKVISELDEQKWQDFVASSDSKNVALGEYYFEPLNTDLSPADLQKVITELFADMVNVGAITLPECRELQDYEFKVSRKGSGSGVVNTVEISLDGAEMGQRYAQHAFNPYRNLNDPAVIAGMKEIVEILKKNDKEFQSCTDDARKGILLIRSFTDDELLEGARDETSAAYLRAFALLGPETNPTWITARCAETAYDRRLIDDYELDKLTF